MHRVYVITMSDSAYYDGAIDISTGTVIDLLGTDVYKIVDTKILPDDLEMIKAKLCEICDNNIADLIITTGGTGLSDRDNTPDATIQVADKMVPGIAQAMMNASLNITPRAMLSRATAAIRKKTLIINLPGSPKACRENLNAVLPALSHAIRVLSGESSESLHGRRG